MSLNQTIFDSMNTAYPEIKKTYPKTTTAHPAIVLHITQKLQSVYQFV